MSLVGPAREGSIPPDKFGWLTLVSIGTRAWSSCCAGPGSGMIPAFPRVFGGGLESLSSRRGERCLKLPSLSGVNVVIPSDRVLRCGGLDVTLDTPPGSAGTRAFGSPLVEVKGNNE